MSDAKISAAMIDQETALMLLRTGQIDEGAYFALCAAHGWSVDRAPGKRCAQAERHATAREMVIAGLVVALVCLGLAIGVRVGE